MTNKELKNCIEKVWECRNICQKTLFDHCLKKGGKHINIEHVKLMTDCIQICQIAADFMTRNSEMHDTICDACAEIAMPAPNHALKLILKKWMNVRKPAKCALIAAVKFRR